jgi:hypothetical protein
MRLKEYGPGLTPNEKCWVGIDQSYSGFAMTLLGDDGSYKTTVAKFDSAGVERLVEIQTHIQTTLKDSDISIQDVAMEGYAYGREFGVAQSGELGGAVKLALYYMNDSVINRGKHPLIIAPTTLKKYVTGKGTGVQKNQMLLNVYKKWGVEFTDDNAADSYGLAHLASGKGKLSYEKEIYAKVNTAESREK